MDKQETPRKFDYKEPFRNFSFPENQRFMKSNALFSTFEAIAVKAVEMQDEMIVKACVDAAKEAGITHLSLVDKQFVVDAIREKMDGTLEKVTRERDAALKQLNGHCWCCKKGKPLREGSSLMICPHFGEAQGIVATLRSNCPHWEWNEGKEPDHEQGKSDDREV